MIIVSRSCFKRTVQIKTRHVLVTFLDLAKRRSSCRHYENKPVAYEDLAYCLESARLAPSACNKQPWRFLVVDDAEKRKQIFQKGRRAGIKHEWLRDVPVFVALCIRRNILTHRAAPAVSGLQYYMIDAGIAGEHFVLAATERGLRTCWIGWFHERRVKKILGVPHNVRIVSLIAVGHGEGHPARQNNSANRMPVKDIGYLNAWKQPFYAEDFSQKEN